jgi:hypothetical protein
MLDRAPCHLVIDLKLDESLGNRVAVISLTLSATVIAHQFQGRAAGKNADQLISDSVTFPMIIPSELDGEPQAVSVEGQLCDAYLCFQDVDPGGRRNIFNCRTVEEKPTPARISRAKERVGRLAEPRTMRPT